jgi:hypothetical protein
MILYLFLSCEKLINKNYKRIKNMMNKLNYEKYVIITGGHSENIYNNNNKRLKLNCNDTYEGLSEKVIKAYKFIYENEQFNDIPYRGCYVPWCTGGHGYVLSKKSLKILKNNKNYNNEIYEDLYIAKVLRRNKIFPKQLRNIKTFFISPDHY